MKIFAACAAVVLLALPGLGMAADATKGEALARQWCTGCHVIDARGSGTDAAPSFPAIARDPARGDANRLTAWLSTSHPNMPNFNLTREAIADLVAYIGTLAQR